MAGMIPLLWRRNFRRERSSHKRLRQRKMTKELIIVLGPTAVGKTDYAINLAAQNGSPVISCDSRQIFRELKIGTAPPSTEQLAKVKHYFVFSHSIKDYYTAGKYEIEALALLNELFKEHDTLIMAGGSGLYVDALCNGLDDFPPADMELRASLMEQLEREGPDSMRMQLKYLDREAYDIIDIANPRRVLRAVEVTIQTGKKYSQWRNNPKKLRPFTISKRCLVRPREELYDRINRRVEIMMENGLVEEVKSLVKYRNMPALNTVGYKEIFDYLDGNTDLPRAVELIKRNTRRYAKKQLTYWGRDGEINYISL